jgi:hypothetical protein
MLTNTLTLQLPEATYTLLVRIAKQIGQTPEDIAAQWLIETVQAEADDPLLQLAGVFTAETTDVSARHDIR